MKNQSLFNSNITKIFSLILYCYIFIILFDGIRESIFLPKILNLLISLLRDGLLIIMLLFVLTSPRKKKFGLFALIFSILVFSPLVIAFVNLLIGNIYFSNVLETIRGCYWTIRPAIFIFVLVNSNIIIYPEQTVKIIVQISVILFAFSLFIYFLFPSLIIAKYYSNRIGLGNPSIQSGLYFCSLILCINYMPFQKSIVNIVCCFILIIAIILTVTSTGFSAVILCLFIFLFDKKRRKYSFVILSVSIIGLVFFIIKYWDTLSLVFDFLIQKIDDLFQLLQKYISLDFEGKTQSSSFSVREKQFERFFSNVTNSELVFGKGKFAISDPEESMIENLFIAKIHDFGFFGLAYLVFILLNLFIVGFKEFIVRKKSFLIVSVMGFILYGMTLDILVLFNLAAMFTIVFYFSYFRNGDY